MYYKFLANWYQYQMTFLAGFVFIKGFIASDDEKKCNEL